MKIQELKKPLSFKWRVQSFSKHKPVASCIPYVDSRDVQNRLDEVCGAGNWQDDYKEIKGNVYAGIGIFIEDRWVWKWDCGKESQIEKEKGEASDAFKRAAVKWGIARDAYNEKIQYVRTNDKNTGDNSPYCIDDSNSRVYDLTEHINKKLKVLPEWFNDAVEWVKNGGDVLQVIAQKKPSKEIEAKLLKACS